VNQLKQEKCALKKVRSELARLKGRDGDFLDCKTSSWREEVCTASCGGGKRRWLREIVQKEDGGAACGPLAKVEPCNEHPCPVDCKFGPWEAWSQCSAECDGGVRERMRPVKVRAKNGGKLCLEPRQADACNGQACTRDCQLADWTEWTACSKLCDTGSQHRSRAVAEEPLGLGKCPRQEAKERLQFKPCNTESCQELLPEGRTTLRCSSKLDVIVLLDGSGSLGREGWNQTRAFAARLVENLEGGDDKVHVALQLFSGPSDFDAYKRCTSNDPNAQPDMARDCGIVWVKHLTSRTVEVARMVPNIEWPAGSTFMSSALAEAQGELQYGRQHTRSLVVVISDGKPISHIRTKEAARRLKRRARVLWVPIGMSSDMDLVTEMASLPREENIVRVERFEELDQPAWVNKLIANACPHLS